MTVLAINPGQWTAVPVQYQDMFRLFLEKSSIGCNIDEDSQRIESVPSWLFACPNSDTLELILRNQLVTRPTDRLFRPDQILDLPQRYICRLESPTVLLRLFGISWSSTATTKLPAEIKEHLLHLAAAKVGYQAVHCPSHWNEPDWSRTQWLRLVRDLIVAGANPTAIKDGTTALLSSWRFSAYERGKLPTWPYQEDRMKDIFDRWIQTEQEARIDLPEYVKLEQQAWSVLRSAHHSESKQRQTELVSSLEFPPYQVESLLCGSEPSDCSFTLRKRRRFTVWQQSQVPGSLENGVHPSMCVTTVTSEGDRPEIGWTKFRTISTLSRPVNVREFHMRDKHRDIRVSATIEHTQDDSRPLSLASMWHSAYSARRRRGRSLPPGTSKSRRVNTEWTSHRQADLAVHHLSPITIFESSPLIDQNEPCACLKTQLPEHHQYKPYWYRVMCVRGSESLQTNLRKDKFYCPAQRTRRLE